MHVELLEQVTETGFALVNFHLLVYEVVQVAISCKNYLTSEIFKKYRY